MPSHQERVIQIAKERIIRAMEHQAARREDDATETQRVLRAEFEAVMAAGSLEEFEQQYQTFVMQRGLEAWQKQAKLSLPRAQKEQATWQQ